MERAVSGGVSLVIVRAVVDAVQRLDVGKRLDGELLAALEAWNGNPYAQMPRQQFVSALSALQTALDLPELGLRVAQGMTGMSFHVVSALVATRTTLREALETFTSLNRDVLGGPPWTLVEDGDRATYGFADACAPVFRIDVEMAIATFQRSLCHSLGEEDAAHVWGLFGYAAPAHADRYAELLSPRVRFAAGCNGVELPRAYLDRASPGASAEVAEAVRAMSAQWLARPTSLTAQVRHALSEQEDLSDVEGNAIAKRLAMSPRTLRRRLEREGERLSALLDEARAARAKGLLQTSSRSLAQIAEELGYREPNSFNRAFKRWFGVTPARFRADRR